MTKTFKAASVNPKRLMSEAVAKVEAAMGLFSQLRETLERADTVQLRELLSRTIDKVEVWSTKWPIAFRLDRGVIHLRSDQFDNLLPSS